MTRATACFPAPGRHLAFDGRMRRRSTGLALAWLLAALPASQTFWQSSTPSPAEPAVSDDLYEALELEETATEVEIKKAYRRMSLKSHPDKGGSAAAFKQVTRAYEVLSDGDKRALYDVGGMSAVEHGVGGKDIFGRSTGVQRGPDVTSTVSVPLEDIYRSSSVRVRVRRRIVCRGCNAQTQLRRPTPLRCEGCTASCPDEAKTVLRQVGHMRMNQQVYEPSQERCRQNTTVLVATVERGAADGTEVRFARASEHTPGQIPGSVVVTIRALKHAAFSREGDDLRLHLAVPLRHALLGFERTIRHLDGHEVRISSGGRPVSPNEVLTLRGEGMPKLGRPGQFGQLHVACSVTMPKTLTPFERAFVEKAFEPEPEPELSAMR